MDSEKLTWTIVLIIAVAFLIIGTHFVGYGGGLEAGRNEQAKCTMSMQAKVGGRSGIKEGDLVYITGVADGYIPIVEICKPVGIAKEGKSYGEMIQIHIEGNYERPWNLGAEGKSEDVTPKIYGFDKAPHIDDVVKVPTEYQPDDAVYEIRDEVFTEIAYASEEEGFWYVYFQNITGDELILDIRTGKVSQTQPTDSPSPAGSR